MTGLRSISDYMASEVITIPAGQEVNAALTTLLEHRISGAPVVDAHGAMVGILTEKDCLRAALEASYYRDWGRSVADYMSHEVTALSPDTDLLVACQTFLDGPYRRFPVLEDGRLVGIVSRTDILRGLADLWGQG